MRGPFRSLGKRGGATIQGRRALQLRRFMDGHAAETIASDGNATVKGSWHDTAAEAGWREAKFSSMVA
jgi:hypothetical protein